MQNTQAKFTNNTNDNRVLETSFCLTSNKIWEVIAGTNSKNQAYKDNIHMGGALVFVEPDNPSKARKDPTICQIVFEGELNTFIDRCIGHDSRLADMVV